MAFSLRAPKKSADLQLKPGLFHYEIHKNGGKARVHLRVDPDNTAILMVNASRVVHLNPTAAQMAYLFLQETPKLDAIKFLRQVYNVPRKKAGVDYLETTYQLEQIMDEQGACPVCDLALDKTLPFSSRPSAPYRMDLAITYRCNNACSHCYNARPRSFPELDTQTWKQILDRIWELGIPHVVFTGGEPTLRDDLPELVGYAENKGLISGINTNGRRLADQNFFQELVDAGLDHVQITLESHDRQIHDEMVQVRGAWQDTIAGLRNVVNSKLYMMTNTTLLTNNAYALEQTLNFLANEGVPTVGLNALIYAGHGATVKTGLNEEELPALLKLARRITTEHHQKLIWYTPTQYCHFNPMDLQLGIKGCTAALYNMCIEPDGSVLPCQSYYEGLGNILSDSWSSIWQHPLAVRIREREDIPEGCQHCDFFVECGGGCPLARAHQQVKPIQMDVFV